MLAVLAVSLALAPPGLDSWQSMRQCLRKRLDQQGTVDLQFQRVDDAAALLDHVVGKDVIQQAQKCSRARPVEDVPAQCQSNRTGTATRAYQLGPQTFVCEYDDEDHVAILWRQPDAAELSLEAVLKWVRLPACAHPALAGVGAWPLVSLSHDRQRLAADTKPEKAATSELAKKLKALPPPVDFVRRSSGWTWLSTPAADEEPDKIEQSTQGTLIACGTGHKARDSNAGLDEQLDEAIAILLAPKGGSDAKAKGEAFALLKKHAPVASDKLLAMLSEETSATLTNPNLLLALGRLGQPSSVEGLRRAVENSSDGTAKIAAQALAEHPHAEAGTALVALLESDREPTVTIAAGAVVLRKDKLACPALAAAQARAPEAKTLRDAISRLRCAKK